MFDIKLIRDDAAAVREGLAKKNFSVDIEAILANDKRMRELMTDLDDLRSEKNAANDEISQAIAAKEDPKPKIAAMKVISDKIKALEPQVQELQNSIKEQIIGIPNLPHASVPVGGEDKNEVVRTWGEPVTFDFKPKTHIELAEALDIIDFKRAAKISGAGFILFKGAGVTLLAIPGGALFGLVCGVINLPLARFLKRKGLPNALVCGTVAGTGLLAAADAFFLTGQVPVYAADPQGWVTAYGTAAALAATALLLGQGVWALAQRWNL